MEAEVFKQRYVPCHPKLYRIAYAMLNSAQDAEDILQEAYCKLWSRRAELAGIRQPEAFCVTLVKNLCADFLRMPENRRNSEPAETARIALDETPETDLESREQLRQIKKLINRLPEKQRTVIKLRGWGDCSLDEIGTITGESAANVRVLLSRARKTLKEMMIRQNINTLK
jgi:RNA polymerase sigma-70 factor (ECF subfamily)